MVLISGNVNLNYEIYLKDSNFHPRLEAKCYTRLQQFSIQRTGPPIPLPFVVFIPTYTKVYLKKMAEIRGIAPQSVLPDPSV